MILIYGRSLLGRFYVRRLTTEAMAPTAISLPAKSILPPNLTVIGLPIDKSKERRVSITVTNKSKSTGLKKSGEFDIVTRREKKKQFISGKGVALADRLSKNGQPLLKNMLRDSIASGNFGPAVAACEERLQSREPIDNRKLTTMLRTFGVGGEPDKAIALFKRIGSDQSIRVRLDNHHCATVIHACGVNLQWWKALDMLHYCKKHKLVSPNAVVYGAAMAACMRGKRFDKVLHLFEELLSSRLKADASCYNIVISAAAKAGQHEKALDFFSRMLNDTNVRPDAITYVAVLNSCAVSGDYERALSLLHDIKVIPWIKISIKMYTPVVCACIKAARPMEALEVIREVCRASSISMLSADVDASGDISSELLHWKFPGTRFSGAKNEAIGDAPDSLLLGLGIAACSMRQSLSGLAVQFLDQIIVNKMTPTYAHISNVIKCLENDGNIAESLRIYEMCVELGHLRPFPKEFDLFSSQNTSSCTTQLKSESQKENSRLNDTVRIDMTGLFGDHMLRTRLRLLFQHLLRMSTSEYDGVAQRLPRVLLFAGKDQSKKKTIQQFVESDSYLKGISISPNWIEKQGVFVMSEKLLFSWANRYLNAVKRDQNAVNRF